MDGVQISEPTVVSSESSGTKSDESSGDNDSTSKDNDGANEDDKDSDDEDDDEDDNGTTGEDEDDQGRTPSGPLPNERTRMTLLEFLARYFDANGKPVAIMKIGRTTGPESDGQSGGSDPGSGKDGLVDPVNDPAGIIIRGGGSDPGSGKDGLVDPMDDVTGLIRIRGSRTLIIKPNPIGGSSNGASATDGGQSGGNGLPGNLGLLGGGAVAPNASDWYCPRTLLEGSDGALYCYCAVSHHPITGESIPQWLPVSVTAVSGGGDPLAGERNRQCDRDVNCSGYGGSYDPYNDPCF